MALSTAPDRHLTVLLPLALALSALAVLPIWVVDLVPLLDLPPYLHAATILHEWPRNPTYQEHFFLVGHPVPGWLTLAGLDAVAHLGGMLVAQKVVLTACLLAVPAAALALLRAAGQSAWLVLGVLPWMLGADFFLGHLPFLAAFPLLIALLAAHVGLLRRGAVWRAVLVAGLLALLAVTHWVTWLLGLALLPLLSAWSGAQVSWRKALLWPLRDLALGLPSVALLVPWLRELWQVPPAGPSLLVRQALPLDNLAQIADRMFDVFAPHDVVLGGIADLLLRRQGDVASGLWLLGLAFWALGAARQPRPPPVDVAARPAVEGSAYLGHAVALVAAGYFLLPRDILAPIDLRGFNGYLVPILGTLAVMALPLRPVLPPARARARVWLGTLAMVVVAVLLPIATLQAFLLARAELGAIAPALERLPPGKAVLTLRTDLDSRHLRARVWSYIGDYPPVFANTYAPPSFAGDRTLRVRVRPRRQLPAPPIEDPLAFTWHEHGRFYDYIAAVRDPRAEAPTYEAWLRNLPKIFQRGPWQVFQNLRVTAFPPPPEPAAPPARPAPE